MPQEISKKRGRGGWGSTYWPGSTGTIDWQVGFGDNTDGFFDFLGIAEGKKEQKAREDTLRQARGEFPAATSCAQAQELIPVLQKRLADVQALIDNGEKRVAPRFLWAYNVILQECIQYASSQCKPAVADPAGGAPVPKPAVNADPIAQSALPSKSGVGTTIKEKITQKLSSVPAWAWASGGAALALAVVIAIVKKK
jgi:hypothetical protein